VSNQIGFFVAQVLVAAFLAVLFLQSGLNKVLDWSGNRAYIASVFEQTPLRRFSALMLLTITVMEVGAGVLSAAGAVAVLVAHQPHIAFAGAALSSLSVLSLFFGQRIAKDYAGAAGLVPYFLLTVVALLLEGQFS
jgi:uncharacterized membrane protein YphA (DoxX/SURF4 family)